MPDKQPHTVYKTLDGKRVPSVTTYLGILNKPALMHWSWELGVAGLDYRKVRDQYGDTGSLVHYLVLCQLEGREPDYDQYSPMELATTVFPMEKFNGWAEGKELEPILLEQPMVSEVYRFGGTPDYYGKIDSVLTLLDFKTSNGIYSDYFHQVAAYKKLLEEHGHIVDDVRILRFSRNEGEDIEDCQCGDFEHHWEIFLACQKIYETKKLCGKVRKPVE